MADNNTSDKSNVNNVDTQTNPLKSVKTKPLPTKHEFSSKSSDNKKEKR